MFGARDVAGSIRFLVGLLALGVAFALTSEAEAQKQNPQPPEKQNPQPPGKQNPEIPGKQNPQPPGKQNPEIPGKQNPQPPGKQNPEIPQELLDLMAKEDQFFKSISKPGPFKAKIGHVAEIDIPEGFLFVDRKDMAKLNEHYQNPTSPNHLAAVLPASHDWFILFIYSEEGHVKDDEKDKLDAAAILQGLREGQEQDNKARIGRNWPPLTLLGWEQVPFFDDQTKNLTWALKIGVGNMTNLNYNSRILSRQGHTSANLVVDDVEQLKQTLPIYKKLLSSFHYVQGQRYDEWKPGDKVAAYGLAALIGGGAVAVAAKTGLLAKLIKPIIVGIMMLFGGIGAFFRKIFRRSRADA